MEGAISIAFIFFLTFVYFHLDLLSLMAKFHGSFGRFAAALIENKLDSWVMNVVPVSGPNTLPVIYDRGLIGVMHDWYDPNFTSIAYHSLA